MEEGVGLDARLSNGLIHERCDSIVIMAGNEFGESPSIELAAGSTETCGKTFGILKDVIRDRHGSFHTRSITAWSQHVNARGTFPINGSRPEGYPSSGTLPRVDRIRWLGEF